MGVHKAQSPEAARAHLQAITLDPPPRIHLESTRDQEAPPPPSYKEDGAQTVAVGSQIAEFASSVPADLRPQITNSFLLAQLAANKDHGGQAGEPRKWYERYVEVLANIGWVIEGEDFSKQEVGGSAIEVHKAIMPVLTVALGPAVAAAAMVTAVLKGLQEMDKDTPWITLFDRESRRASANQFQVSYAEAPEGKAPRVSLAAFELNAKRSVTQVLFFKFSGSEATLEHVSSKLSMNESIFRTVQPVVEDKVADYVTGYVTDIAI